MTATETLNAGRELDALIAERVMGFRWYRWTPKMDAGSTEDLRGHRFLKLPSVVDAFAAAGWHEPPFIPAAASDPVWAGDNSEVPPYSTDIAAAWAVVEKLNEADWLVTVKSNPEGVPFTLDLETELRPVVRRVVVQLTDMSHARGESLFARRHQPFVFADTAPLAICRAALAASRAPSP